MIIDVYAEKKKRGRKKKVVEEPVIQNKDESVKNEQNIIHNKTLDLTNQEHIFYSSVLTKRERRRMEKYGIIGYESVVDIFNNICVSKNLPNLTIYGDSGSGKSYLINWLLSKLFKNHFRERVLYISLNDERGISTMREKIKAFSNIQVKDDPEIPSFKVIVFDQAEYISLDAQNALRRIIELSNNISRFIFLTRNTRCIIDPILSRCLQLNLNTNAQVERIEKYLKFFPGIQREVIEEVCRNYSNFGREIATFEILSEMNEGDIVKYNLIEKVISDRDCDELMRLFSDNSSKLVDYVNYISEKMKNINLSLSLKKIYDRMRKEGYNLLSISNFFLQFEISANMDSSENVFLLDLLRNCSLEKKDNKTF